MTICKIHSADDPKMDCDDCACAFDKAVAHVIAWDLGYETCPMCGAKIKELPHRKRKFKP